LIALTDERVAEFRRDGFLLLRGALAPHEAADLGEWVSDLESRPEAPGRWMKYFERSSADDARQLCRVENFLEYHDGLRGLLQRTDLLAALAALFGEPAVLFKEKINYKLPGGGGFAAHQDAPAFRSFGQSFHITVLIGVDDATAANGCLEFGRGAPAGLPLPEAEDGTLAPSAIGALAWEPLPTSRADVLFFDSYVPHRSGPNLTSEPRRVLYVTYNRASEGDRRDEYYAMKRRCFPPECERVAGQELPPESKLFNVGNPIR
jgi:2-aminoethylphosphonate dioxygenase